MHGHQLIFFVSSTRLECGIHLFDKRRLFCVNTLKMWIGNSVTLSRRLCHGLNLDPNAAHQEQNYFELTHFWTVNRQNNFSFLGLKIKQNIPCREPQFLTNLTDGPQTMVWWRWDSDQWIEGGWRVSAQVCQHEVMKAWTDGKALRSGLGHIKVLWLVGRDKPIGMIFSMYKWLQSVWGLRWCSQG